MIKKIIYSLIALFLAYQAISLISKIDNFNIKSSLLLLLLAVFFNLLVTGIFAFTVFVFPTQKLLPESYYTIKNPKRLKRTIKNLKIEYFRTFLLATVWRNKNKQKRYFSGYRDGFKNLKVQSKKSEFGHLIPLIILSLLSLYFMFNNKLLLGFFTLIINIVFNFYPIPLQRHHRMRISILEKRYNIKQ